MNQTRILTSHFHSPHRHHSSLCQAYHPLPQAGKPHCQTSQRMFQTAHQIHERLHNTHNHSSVGLFQEGCTGHQKKLPHDPYLIVVWEHTEIIDWIRQSGLHIGLWEDETLYNLVFHLTTGAKPRLQYDCVDVNPVERQRCWQATSDWLANFPTEEPRLQVMQHKVGRTEAAIVLAFYLFFLFFLLAKSLQRPRRQEGYIDI